MADTAQCRARGRIAVILAVLVAAAHVAYAAWRATHASADLVGFHRAAVHWWHTGAFTNVFGAQFYTPAFVVLMTPVVVWPLPVAGSLMGAVNVLVFVHAVRTCSRLAARGDRLPAALAWGWPILLVFPFASGTIALGQVNLIVLWLCLLAYSQASRGRQVRSGLLVALAGLLKLYPLILTLYWLLKGQWRVAASAWISFLLLAAGIGLAAFGVQGSLDAHRQWLGAIQGAKYRAVLPTQPAETPTGDTTTRRALTDHLIFTDQRTQWHRHNNQSLAAVIRRLTTDLGADKDGVPAVNVLCLPLAWARRLYLAAALAVLLLLSTTTWRRRCLPEDFAEWSAWLAGTIAFVPLWWTHYFVLLLPALTCLCVAVWRDRQHGQRGLVATGLQAAWLIGLLLLAWKPFCLVGGHCWLALAIMTWALLGCGNACQSPPLPREDTGESGNTDR